MMMMSLEMRWSYWMNDDTWILAGSPVSDTAALKSLS